MTVHDPEELTAHALGLLSEAEAHAVEDHLRGCADCRHEWERIRETAALVASVPSETLVDGPPTSDLALRRALRSVQEQAPRPGPDPTARPGPDGAPRSGPDGPPRHRLRRRRPIGRLVAVAAAALVLVVGGAVVGRLTAPEPTTTVAVGPGSSTASGEQGPVRMTATVSPAAGWVRVQTEVQGIAPGKRCTLEVEGADGTTAQAAYWLSAPPAVPGRPTPVAGSAIVDPGSVRAVSVRDEGGDTLVRVPLVLDT